MAFRWRWFLILLALILGGAPLFAAPTKEQRAYTAGVSDFQIEMWSRAETDFAQFIQAYPKSTNAPQAVLLQARAEYKQGKLKEAIALLNARKAGAGHLADQYAYWIGEVQYADSNFQAAAQTFVSLAHDFPDSSLRLRAVVEAAAAYAQIPDWAQHDALLDSTNGIFQRTAQLDPANELVLNGQLSRENSRFQQHDFPGVAAIYGWLTNQWLALPTEQRWQGTCLFCQSRIAVGDTNAALAAVTNLLQIARSGEDNALLAESVALHAELLEQSGLKAEALAVYQENLTNAPAARQRQAILKIADLAAALGRFSTAEDSLRDFIAQFAHSPAADIALLSLGGLCLKDYLASRPAELATNQLQAATAAFDRFLGAYTNSPLAGKAYLDRGWCGWFWYLDSGITEDTTNSLADFEAAAKGPLPAEDLAVARFKMGDVLFVQKDFTNALKNYRSVVDDFARFPAVRQALGNRALYQSLRACLEMTNTAAAEDTMEQILKQYPAGEETGNSLLLMGEYLADLSQPTNALAVFQRFESLFPDSPLRPRVELAIAYSCEQGTNWAAAIERYEKWLTDFPTNALRSQAVYALARANYQAGNETNAFILFTNFVAQFPTDDLTPLAQWWVAGHFFNAGDYPNAEKNYKFIYQNFATNDLAYPAKLMAGRAAVARQDYAGAIRDYFLKLEVDTNCDMALRIQAAFAHGHALMMDSTDTNNPLANFQRAASVFSQICQLNPTNRSGARAWVEIGDCELQLTNYDAATNAYAQVLDTNVQANISLRSQAQIGIGIALGGKAGLATGDDQAALFQLALGNYLEVFDATNLRDGETPDWFWVKEAGWQALPLIETLGVANPNKFIDQMERLLPQLKDSLEKTRAALPPPKS